MSGGSSRKHLIWRGTDGTWRYPKEYDSVEQAWSAVRGGYSTITPDLVIEETATGRSVPVDIKYKAYDVKKISTGDIYQTFLYAYALGDDPTERRAGILYPTTMPTYGARLSVKPVSGPTAARVAGAGINVPRALDALGTVDRTALLTEIRETVCDITGFGG